jgi:predicted transcriptional regulator
MNKFIKKSIDKYPTASEVFDIEKILKESKESAINYSKIYKQSNINKEKLTQILLYLEKTKKILIDEKNNKIIYISNSSSKLLSSIKKGIEYG